MLKPSAVVELVWQDETGSTASTMLSISSALSVATIETSAAALVSFLSPLTGCVLVRQRIKYTTAPESGASADGSNPITHCGALFFEDDTGETAGLVTIPGIVDSVLMSTGPGAGVVIDVSNADIQALVSAMLDLPACNPMGTQFDSLVSGYLQSRV